MSEFNQQGSQFSSFQSTGTGETFKPAKPNNYLVIAIVATVLGLCSCIPFVLGIIGIVFATQVDSKYNAGDYQGAESASNTAKILSYIALAISAIGILFNIIYFVIVGASLMDQFY